jgi:hypothetical protein
MIEMKYTVTLKPVVGYEVKSKSVTNEAEAVALAKQWAYENTDPDNGVFIEFYRESDGQHGYINPDGADINGKSWTVCGGN